MAKVSMTTEKITLLEDICRLKPTLVDCGEILKIHPRTIERWITANYKETFTEFRDKRLAHTRLMIVRNIIKQCEHGNTTMLIYASKNLCKWTDKPIVDEINFNELSLEELKAITKKSLDYIKEREEKQVA